MFSFVLRQIEGDWVASRKSENEGGAVVGEGAYVHVRTFLRLIFVWEYSGGLETQSTSSNDDDKCYWTFKTSLFYSKF